jgi:hypothetical protein
MMVADPIFRSRHWTAVVMAAFVLVSSQCGNAPTSEGPRLAPTQPNRTSPLAESMRQLDAELVDFRTRFLDVGGEWDDAAFSVYDLNDLAPTDSSMFVDGYQALAIAFEKRIADFNAQPSGATYSLVVSGCISCHQKACPGPLERIAKRKLP